jgi:hypothetical protein
VGIEEEQADVEEVPTNQRRAESERNGTENWDQPVLATDQTDGERDHPAKAPKNLQEATESSTTNEEEQLTDDHPTKNRLPPKTRPIANGPKGENEP